MIPPERLFWPCIVCGDEYRYIDMFACLNCNEPICEDCVRQDGFCSDECYDTFHEDGDEDEYELCLDAAEFQASKERVLDIMASRGLDLHPYRKAREKGNEES